MSINGDRKKRLKTENNDVTEHLDDDECRVLRSSYLSIQNYIRDQRDEIAAASSKEFLSIIKEVDGMHHHVKKPREQVSDAVALRDLANTLVTSLKVQNNGRVITPSLFVSSLITEYGKKQRKGTKKVQLHWKDLGLHVSPLLKNFKGASTMFGPMLRKPKPPKAFTQRKGRTAKEQKMKPEETDGISKEKSKTDLTIAKMFDILKRKRNVCLENLVLNRISFAQTVENLFALSFLVKDGRVVITVDEKGSHHVSPRNAPASRFILSREVEYSHFVFSFSFNDWKLMKDFVTEGSELMPHRIKLDCSDGFSSEPVPNTNNNQTTETVTKTYSRKSGVKHEQSCEMDSTTETNIETYSRKSGVKHEQFCEMDSTTETNIEAYSRKNQMKPDESRKKGSTGLKLIISMKKRKITRA